MIVDIHHFYFMFITLVNLLDFRMNILLVELIRINAP